MSSEKSRFSARTINLSLYAACLAATVALIYLLAVLSGFAPFGGNSFACVDADIQYLDFFAYLKRVLRGEASLAYTFEKVLGGNNVAVFSYYLTSPFNLLVLFFEQKDFHSMFTLMVAGKLGVAAAFFAIYLRARFPRMKPLFAACLSLGYGLCQYGVAQASNIMWLDGVYMLPLILLGTWKLVQNGRNKLLLILSVALSLLFNWYTAGINCMFCCIYYLYEDTLANRFAPRAFLLRALRFAACLVLGALLSMFLIFPTLLALRGGRAGLDFFLLQKNYLENIFSAFTQFRIGGTSSEGSVSLYCGFFALFGCFAYFFTGAERGRARNIVIVFLCASALIFFFSPFVFAFSMFKSVTSYWYRYSYLGIFSVLCVSARFYERAGNQPLRVDLRRAWPAAAIAAVLFIALGLQSFLFALLSFALAAALLYCYNRQLPDGAQGGQTGLPNGQSGAERAQTGVSAKSGKLLRAAAISLGILIAAEAAAELSFNASLLMQEYSVSNAEAYAEYVMQQQEQIAALRAYDGGFYRINQTSTRNTSSAHLTANYNESLAYGYRSISGYTSDPNDRERRFLDKLGYNIMGDNMNIVNTSIVAADALLGVKYVLADSDINGLIKLDELGTYNGKSTYQNPYALPLAFTYPKSPAFNSEETTPFLYQNQLYSFLLGEEIKLYREAEYSAETDGGETVYTTRVPETACAMYGQFLFNDTGAREAVVNEETTYSLGRWLSPEVIYIGTESGSTATVRIADGNVRESNIYYLDLDALAKAAETLQGRAAENLAVRDGSVRCTVHSDGNERVFFSIPYEDGWKITVNGERADFELIGDCMLSVALGSGENEIVLEFSVPGLAAGIAASAAGAGITALLAYCDFRGVRIRDVLPWRKRKHAQSVKKTVA